MVGKRPSTFGSGAQADTDTRLAGVIKRLFTQGDKAKAREHFGEIVERHQRRASRVAYHYLRDAAEVDDAVQDAFVKAFVHLPSFREELPFEVWFTRIVINGCLDRLKARARRGRWMVGAGDQELELDQRYARPERSPEDLLLAGERRARLVAAVERLPARQRTVVTLSHFDGRSTREVSAITGLNESTVRVHLFRAVRTLRKDLRGERWLIEQRTRATEATRD